MAAVMWVALGGAAGSAVRHLFNNGVTRLLGEGFPWGILAINVVGCFAMGLLAAATLRGGNDTMRLFLATGFLGGFTTFSAFALDTMKLVQGGQGSFAFAYVAGSVGLSLLAVFAGFAVLRAIA